ncbi:hypothetical protein CPC16_005898, partial [Podila verticillata]
MTIVSPKKARLSGEFHSLTAVPAHVRDYKHKPSKMAMKPKALWMNPVVRPRPLPRPLWVLADEFILTCIVQMHIASGAMVMFQAGSSPNQPSPHNRPIVAAATHLRHGNKDAANHVLRRHQAIHAAPIKSLA